MEGRFQDPSWVIRTHGHDLWAVQCTSHFSNLYGHPVRGPHRHRSRRHLPRRHFDICHYNEQISLLYAPSPETSSGPRPLLTTCQMFFQPNIGRIPRSHYLRRRTPYGPHQTTGSPRLATPQVGQRHSEIFRFLQLLSTICPRLFYLGASPFDLTKKTTP